jgi:hypothetical protein
VLHAKAAYSPMTVLGKLIVVAVAGTRRFVVPETPRANPLRGVTGPCCPLMLTDGPEAMNMTRGALPNAEAVSDVMVIVCIGSAQS